jgi:hypothetical protein
MFSRPNARHSQNAYVTNDLDRALAIWRDSYGVPEFLIFENNTPGLVSSPEYRMKIALANVGGLEIELIEPFVGQAPMHSEVLPQDSSFAMRFHHAALRVEGRLGEFEEYIASLDTAASPVVWSGGLGDVMRYVYTDERTTLGHYLEHVWFDPAMYEQMSSAIPVYPPR